MRAPQPARDFEAGQARQVYAEQYDVREFAPVLPERRLPGRDFADLGDFIVLRQYVPQACSDQRLVVDDEYVNHELPPWTDSM
jgi:hypothetical protein